MSEWEMSSFEEVLNAVALKKPYLEELYSTEVAFRDSHRAALGLIRGISENSRISLVVADIYWPRTALLIERTLHKADKLIDPI